MTKTRMAKTEPAQDLRCLQQEEEGQGDPPTAKAAAHGVFQTPLRRAGGGGDRAGVGLSGPAIGGKRGRGLWF